MRDYTSVILDEANYGGLPVAYYPLDEVNGTVARDLINGYDGTYRAGVRKKVNPSNLMELKYPLRNFSKAGVDNTPRRQLAKVDQT